MMESRKRPFADDGEVAQAKKRVLTSVAGSPEVNGIATDAVEPKGDDQLELFRKDAIFRRMRHYSRENERSQARIAQLEQRKSTCEAGLVAIAACWEQLVETIRTLTPPDDVPGVEIDTKDLFDLSQHVSSDFGLKAALEQNMHTTHRLVTSFLKSHPATVNNEAFQRCQQNQTECTALRSEVAVIRKKLEEAESERERYHEELAAAEMRIDRLQSSAVAAMQTRPHPGNDASVEEESQPDRGSSQNPSGSPPHPQINGHDHGPPGDIESLRDTLKQRDERISALEMENNRLTEEVTHFRIEVRAPSVKAIAETSHYKILLDHASQLEGAAAENVKEITQLNETLDQLRTSRKEFEEESLVAAQQANQELRTMLAKRDADNLRVRELRDQYGAELGERKAREAVKLQSIQELRELAESRSERIAQLQSEVARHKAKLAAQAGDADLVKYFFEGKVDDLDYVHELKKKLEDAETKLDAFDQVLSTLQQEHPDVAQHMASEASVRQELVQTSQELVGYRSIFGRPASSLDIETLAQQLQAKEAELQKLRLQIEQQAQAETSLYAEVDRLSASWEGLEQQVKKKVFDVGVFEEKLQRAAHDKAKADNKYFAAMREKEMGESERKAMMRQLEKQGKAVERASEVEKHLQTQVSDLEKMNVLHARAIDNADKKIKALELDVSRWQALAESEKKRVVEATKYASERGQHTRRLESLLKSSEDEISRVKKEAERKLKKISASTVPASAREEALSQEIEGLWKIVKCTTCKQGMREVVLTKCMHTFCKPCVETRIATRQRRCPNCNVGFAQSEVQTVYFQ
ncbi:BRE1 E3 ubiquitin ligase-domain-containing protein [Phlebopus sp. FC_14]|nr:BRE1 E3 ubiquitin ligase-domain-containing protein [Phlebopus sp. FC_14]